MSDQAQPSADASQPLRPPETRPDRWTTANSIITLLASALTFAGGFFALPAVGVDSPTVTKETVTATVTMTAPAPASSGEGGGAPSASSSSVDTLSKRWSGQVKLNQSLELDLLPPEVGLRGDIDSAEIVSSQEAKLTTYAFGTAQFVAPSGDNPSPQECTLLVKTQPVGTVEMTIGTTVCVVSDEGRPALVTLTAIDQEANSVDLDLTVWEKPE